jgi:hypothetical protein
MLQSIALGAGMAWASGLRLYLTVLMAGVLGHFGLIHLPSTLTILEAPWMMGLSGTLAVVEFLADKIPAVDSVWDAVHTFIRIPAGAVLAAGALGHADPRVLLVAGLLGGTLAGSAHVVKAGTRAMINLSPEPFSNWIASLTEDGLTVGGLSLAFFVPVVFLVLLCLFLAAAVWLLPRVYRAVSGGLRSMASQMTRLRAGGKHS